MSNEKETEKSAYELEWQAMEQVEGDRDAIWYLFFGLGTIVLLALTYLLIRDIFAILVISLMAVTLVVYVNRKPRKISYQINRMALMVDGKQYDIGAFRSFYGADTPTGHAIYFEPLQRFMPPISIFFDRDAEQYQQVLDSLSRSLPYKQRQLDFIDQLVHRLRL